MLMLKSHYNEKGGCMGFVSNSFKLAAVLTLIISTFQVSLASALSGPDQFATSAQAQPVFNMNGRSKSPQMIDVNKDGKQDVVTLDVSDESGLRPGYIAVRLGSGDGTFSEVKSTDIGGQYPAYRQWLGDVMVADVDSNGTLDAIVMRSGGAPENTNLGLLDVYLGNGDGTFSTSASQSITTNTNYVFSYLSDIENDGDIDVIATHSPTIVFVNDGSGVFTKYFVDTTGPSNPYSNVLAVADFNSDDKTDLLASGPGSQAEIWLGNGDATFSKVANLTISGATTQCCAYPTVADVNNDGKPDIITMLSDPYLSSGSVATAIRVYLNIGGSQLFVTYSYASSPRVTAAYQSSVADINHDGNPDLVTNDSSHQLAAYLGDGAGHFSAVQIVQATNYDGQPILGDLNNDGNSDVVYGTGSITPVAPYVAMNINPNADSVSPVVTGVASGQANINGWFNADVLIDWLATDPAPSSGGPTQPAQTVASLEGTNTYTSDPSCDVAGNCATGSLSLSIDKTLPLIAGALDLTANSYGWFNQDVTATFNCSDAVSGIAACTAPVVLSNEGQSQSASGTATDLADNSASTSVENINIDETLPTINYALDTAANAQGWHNQDVTVSFSCEDALSGLQLCSLPSTVSSEGASQTVSGIAFDKADNTQATEATINLDKTDPFVSFVLSSLPNQNGWYNQDVTVSYSCIDGLSGIASCSAATSLSAEAANQSATGTGLDNADNTGSVTVAGINIDKTPGTITNATLNAAAYGSFNRTATVTANAADGLSGISAGEVYVDIDPGFGNGTPMTFNSGQLSATFTLGSYSAFSNHTIYVRSVDNAGNWSTTATDTFFWAF